MNSLMVLFSLLHVLWGFVFLVVYLSHRFQDGFEFLILLPTSFRDRGHRCASSCPVYAVLRTKPGSVCQLKPHSSQAPYSALLHEHLKLNLSDLNPQPPTNSSKCKNIYIGFLIFKLRPIFRKTRYLLDL